MAGLQIARMFHTVRYLRAGQVFHRLRRHLPLTAIRPATTARARRWLRAWQPQPTRAAARVAPGTFEFLGERGQLLSPADWNDPARSKLWLYNLHYLDDLNAFGAEDRESELRQLVQRWIDENPPMRGVGWEPYPLSLRIVNLVKCFARWQGVDPTWLASLATQAKALSRQVEYHLLGNHLFANAKALVFAGAFLSTEPANEVLTEGLKILEREIKEQFLADGGHFERSPMYQATLLADLFDLIELAAVSGLPELGALRSLWIDVAVRGAEWLDAMTHPDGEISFFNDAAIGVAAHPLLLARQSDALLGGRGKPTAATTFRLRRLEQSGYFRVDLPRDGAAIVDVAPLGPDYLPAHGHADTLSFELSLFGTRVLVNSGTSLYGESDERLRQRGTAAHNTVVVDGMDSSQVWGGFRVAQRARAAVHLLEEGNKRIVIEGSHDGYVRLPGHNTHWRRWTFGPDSLQVDDTITGRFRQAEARYHLHPSVAVQQLDAEACRAVLRLPGGQMATLEATGAALAQEPSTWHPRFGVSVANHCLTLRFRGRQASARIEWRDAA